MPAMKMMTASQVADRLGVGVSSVYRLASAGELRCARLGPKTLRFAPEWVEEYIARRSTAAPPSNAAAAPPG
jgi:excisionase family DNA binding protein